MKRPIRQLQDTLKLSHQRVVAMLTLAEALPRLMRNELSELNLVDAISDFGAKHLRKAVMTSSTLTVL